MKLELIDLLVILFYIVAVSFIGLYLRKRAQKNKGEYLLGGNKLPWYMLGLSNASGMFDISGTMWLVTLGFIYGLKSIWIPWLWPVFNQVFFMVYLSIWLRRSNVTTGAEWIGTRFGNGKEGKLSHGVVVVYALIGCLGFLAYGFIGLGKFVEIFIPWEYVTSLLNIDPTIIPAVYVPHVYGIIFTLVATFYTIMGGMSSIVWADVLQFFMMAVAGIIVAVIAMKALSGNEFLVPNGWESPFFGRKLELDWSNIIPQVNERIREDGYSLFSAFFMMMVFKGILVSAAGVPPTYDMQKVLATKSPSDAAKMNGFVSVFLMPTRYFMIAGFAVLGLLYYDKLNLLVGGQLDFEQILPSAMNQFIPAGLLGLLLAGLMAAFVSTFAGTLNAAQAYVVNDLYIKYIKPDASNRKVIIANYTIGIAVVIVSIVLGIYAKNIDSLLKWIVSALWGSYVASNILKWYWWRFNGYGYFWGMVTGIIPALIFAVTVQDKNMIFFFPLILVISLIGCFIGTYARPATDENVLKEFYKNVRPWGFWKPILDKVKQENPGIKRNTYFKRDMFNIVIGTIAQTALVALPIYIVIMNHVGWIASLAVFIGCAIIMKRTWWDTLEDYPGDIKK